MTDTKPLPKLTPNAENIEMAKSWLGESWRADMLAMDFAASDAIARRRAIEDCINELHKPLPFTTHPVDPMYRAGYFVCMDIALERLEKLRALLRAPTSEKEEETRAACNMCRGLGEVPNYDTRVWQLCPACSPPADGGGG